MSTTSNLITVADAYKSATGIEKDQTVSYRVFRDSKKLASLREGAGITLKRFNAAMQWFRDNWPEGHAMPAAIRRKGSSQVLSPSAGSSAGVSQLDVLAEAQRGGLTQSVQPLTAKRTGDA